MEYNFKTYGDILKKRTELNIKRTKLAKLTGIAVKTIQNGEIRNSALTAENSALFEGAFKKIELGEVSNNKEKPHSSKKNTKYAQQSEDEFFQFVNEENGIYQTMKKRIENLEYTVELQKEKIKILTEKNKELEADKIKSNNKPKHTVRTV